MSNDLSILYTPSPATSESDLGASHDAQGELQDQIPRTPDKRSSIPPSRASSAAPTSSDASSYGFVFQVDVIQTPLGCARYPEICLLKDRPCSYCRQRKKPSQNSQSDQHNLPAHTATHEAFPVHGNGVERLDDHGSPREDHASTNIQGG